MCCGAASDANVYGCYEQLACPSSSQSRGRRPDRAEPCCDRNVLTKIQTSTEQRQRCLCCCCGYLQHLHQEQMVAECVTAAGLWQTLMTIICARTHARTHARTAGRVFFCSGLMIHDVTKAPPHLCYECVSERFWAPCGESFLGLTRAPGGSSGWIRFDTKTSDFSLTVTELLLCSVSVFTAV